MIELLIQYIRDSGYTVDVRYNVDFNLGILSIRKETKGRIFGYEWVIPKRDLHPGAEEWLYDQATRKCDEIEKMIDEYTTIQPDIRKE